MVNFQCMDHYSMEDLLRIMELLRAPEGCPWDREQTHQSIRRNMLEEAYEVAEAIDNRDTANLKEELGDVLLQVVFHSRMAQEEGLFTFDDVVDGICKKLVFRHPHVFGTVEAGDADGALTAWEKQKREEKGQKTAADSLDGVARSLPALMRAGENSGQGQKGGIRLAGYQSGAGQAVRGAGRIEDGRGPGPSRGGGAGAICCSLQSRSAGFWTGQRAGTPRGL